MEKKYILVFSNGEKLGDGIIKIHLMHEIKRRFSDYNIVWVANGTTVYNNKLKLFSDNYLYKVIEHANLSPFFWTKITDNDFLLNTKFQYIFDTQKAVLRSFALKRLKHSFFISNAANGFFSNHKYIKQNLHKKYYLYDLIDLLDHVKKIGIDTNFKISIPLKIDALLIKVFLKDYKYIGFAPGAGEKDKIWPIENFISIAKYYESKTYKIVWFLGPDEADIKNLIKDNFPKAIYPEEILHDFTNYEIVMASTKFLSLALTNDSGISHILSTNHCPLIKLFGKKDSKKFTPLNKNIITISANEFNSNLISDINKNFVIERINNILN